MKTINRIILSSTLLALISIFIFVTTAGAILFLFSGGGGGFDLQKKDMVYPGLLISEFDISSADWASLNSSVSEYGCSLLVIDNQETIFSTLNDAQKSAIADLKMLNLDENITTGSRSELAFAAKAEGTITIFAVTGEIEENKSWNDFFGDFLPTLVTVGVFVIMVMLLLSLFFTRKMAWRILRPLNALADGASRIENGDFSQPIEYKGNDEFATVCAAFNHMQESLLKEQKKNAAYERARTDMVAGISHDLRTPLTSVKGYIKGLRDGVAATPEKQEQYLSVAYQKACDMDVLLQKLFFFSKLETGNLPFLFSKQELGDFVRRFAEEMEPELKEKSTMLSVDITAVPHPVQMDAEQMRRVLVNLTENAQHYAGTRHLSLKISVWRERDMEHLLFRDNGQGVPEDMLPYLFERFWRGDEARSAKNNEGSGLGLYIVKYIAEAHGGSVSAKNDNGLCIELTLPCGTEEVHEQDTHR